MKIGVIGAGAICRRAHLPAWKLIDDLEVACLVDIDESLLKRVADEFEIHQFTTDYRTILGDDSIQIVDICTPTPTHYEIAMASVAAGKHVIIEKPLALSLGDALALYQEVMSGGSQFCIIQNWRCLDSVARVRERLAAGRLGRLVSVHGRSFTHLPVGWTRSRWPYHPDGVLYDFTPHLIDLVLWLANDRVRSVFAVGRQFTEHADFLCAAQMVLDFEGGAVAQLDSSWITNCPSFSVELFGNGGYLVMNLLRDMFWEGHGSETPLDDLRCFLRKMVNLLHGIANGSLSTKQLSVYKPLFEAFVESIVTGGEPPATIEQGVWVNVILEAAKRSIVSGERVPVQDVLLDAGASRNAIEHLHRGDVST